MAGVRSIGQDTKDNATRREQVRTVGFKATPVPAVIDRISSAPTAVTSIAARTKSKKGKEKAIEYDTKPSMSRFVAGPPPRRSVSTHSVSTSSKETVYVPIVHSDDDVSSMEGEDEEDGLEIVGKPKRTRHKDGTIIERIPLGPIQHRKIRDDPDFEKIEPNSGIRLK